MKIKEIVQIDKKEFDRIPWNLAKSLLAYFKKGYGYELISREDNTRLDLFTEFGENAFIGFLTTHIQMFLKRDKE